MNYYYLWVLAFLQGFIIDILGKNYVLVNDIGNYLNIPKNHFFIKKIIDFEIIKMVSNW